MTERSKARVLCKLTLIVQSLGLSLSWQIAWTNGSGPPPSAPTNLIASSYSNSQINLQWTDNSSDEERFTLEYSFNGTSWSFLDHVDPNVTTYQHTGLTAATRYYYRLRAWKSAAINYSDYTNPIDDDWTRCNAPAAPSVEPISSTQLKPSWSAVSGATGYKVFRATSSGGTYVQQGGVTTNVYYNDSGLSAGTVYYYKIVAVNQGGDSAYSPYGSRSTLPTVPPNFRLGARTPYSVTMAWDDVDGETGYTLEANSGEAASYDIDQDDEDFIITDNVSPGSSIIDVRIRWYNSYGNGAWTNTMTVYAAPTAPGSLTATPASHAQINLSWTNVDGETGYRVERSPNGSTGWTQIATKSANVTSHQDTYNLNPATQYYYRVYPYNQGGDGDPSPTANAWTLVETPGSFQATAATENSITLGWNDVTGESGYTVEENHYTHGIRTAGTVGANVTTFVADDDLEGGKSLQYRVRANGAHGNSLWTNWLDVKTPPTAATAAIDSVVITTATLEWTDVEGEEGYVVERSPNELDWAPLTSPALDPDTVIYADGETTYATTYHYRVRSFVTNGAPLGTTYSDASNTTMAKTAPLMTEATHTSSGGVLTLEWDPVAGEDGFYILRSANGGAWTTVTQPFLDPDVESFQDTASQYDNKYAYEVYAYSDYPTGRRADSAPWETGEIVVPPRFEATYLPNGAVEFVWQFSTNATGSIQRRAIGSGSWATLADDIEIIANQEGSHIDYTGVVTGVSYEYRLDIDGVGLSGLGDPAYDPVPIEISGIEEHDRIFEMKDALGETIAAIDTEGQLLLRGTLETDLGLGGQGLQPQGNGREWILSNPSGTPATIQQEDYQGVGRGTMRIAGQAETFTAPGPSNVAFRAKSAGNTKAVITDEGDFHFNNTLFENLPQPDLAARWEIDSGAILNWDYPAAAGVDRDVLSFLLERSTTAGFENPVTIQFPMGSAPYSYEHIENGLPGDEYYYRIRVVALEGESPDFTAVPYSLPSPVRRVFRPAAFDLPAGITMKSLSPLFPTPNSFADLPDRYTSSAFQGREGAQYDELLALSPVNILSMFVFYPNLTWKWDKIGDDYADGWNQGVLRGQTVNDTGTNWGPVAFAENGDAYIMGGDSAGLEHGVALFNRKIFSQPVIRQERLVFNRLKDLVPGQYDGTRSDRGVLGPRGKVLGWYRPWGEINLHHHTIPNPTERPPAGASLFATGLLYLNGHLYLSASDSVKQTASGPKVEVYSDNYKHDVSAIFRVRGIDDWKSDHAVPYADDPDITDPAKYSSGREWEEEYPGDPNDRSYIHIVKPDGAYLAVDSSGDGSMADQLLDGGTNNYMWQNSKFTFPTFVQFGKGNRDYVEPSGESLAADEVFVYSISIHHVVYAQDALYLGRSKVRLGEPGRGNDRWGTWEYFVGVNTNGIPYWTTDIEESKSILYAEGAAGHPFMIYEPNSKLYILSAVIANNSQHIASATWRYNLYVSRAPWGPWRKAFTNDYNGLINRAAQDIRYQAGSPDDVHLLASPIEAVDDYPAAGDRTIRFWMYFGRLEVWTREMVYGRTGVLMSETGGGDPGRVATWDEYFPGTYYVPCFQEIEMTVPADTPAQPTFPAAVETEFPEFRPEGPFHYDHWGWRVEFDGGGNIATTPTFSLDPLWVGHRFKVGPRDIAVDRLGRMYLSGNTLSHPVRIVTATGDTAASATISNGGNLFAAPGNVAPDGCIYEDLSYPVSGEVALEANGEYYLLSREGIGEQDMDAYENALAGPDGGLNYSSIEYASQTAEAVAFTSATHYVGYRFRTGPLGLRVVGVLGWNGNGARDVVIEEAKTQTVADSQNIYTFPLRFRDSGLTRKSYSIPSGTTREINSVVFNFLDVSSDPIDLKPLTEYYIGMEVEQGDDAFFKANGTIGTTQAYDKMAKLRLNPNMMQFIHPAARQADPVTSWTSVSRMQRPSFAEGGGMNDGGPYDDGVGLEPAVEMPVGLMCIVPDRFEGYRNPVGADGKEASDYFGMPVIEELSEDLPLKVLGSGMQATNGSYGTTTSRLIGENLIVVSLFHESPWRGNPYYHTFGPGNSTFGPLDLVLGEGQAERRLIANGDIGDYYNADSYTSNDPKTKARIGQNNWFVQPETALPPGLPDTAGVYSGMQIRVTTETTLTKVGRYFPPGVEEPLENHKIVVMRSAGFEEAAEPPVIAIGQIDGDDYNFSTGSFAYATLHAPSTDVLKINYDNLGSSIALTLEQGEIYFIGVWDGIDATSKSFGWIEDYPRYKTGSALAIEGPTRAAHDNANDKPDMADAHTVLLNAAGDGYPQGYGPLNVMYRLVVEPEEDYEEGFALYRDIASPNYSAPPAQPALIANKIDVGASPAMVTHVGRWKFPGVVGFFPANTGRHRVAILRATRGARDAAGRPTEVVASAVVDASQAAASDGYNYARLERPVVLRPGESYYIATTESGGDQERYLGAVSSYAVSTNPLFGTGLTIDTSNNYTMNEDGTWDDSAGFAPLVNLKIN